MIVSADDFLLPDDVVPVVTAVVTVLLEEGVSAFIGEPLHSQDVIWTVSSFLPLLLRFLYLRNNDLFLFFRVVVEAPLLPPPDDR